MEMKMRSYLNARSEEQGAKSKEIANCETRIADRSGEQPAQTAKAPSYPLIVNGETRGKDYWSRIRAVGPNGPRAWSAPATILVA